MDKENSVGILTLYYNNTNYGGQLQAYALQKVVESMGYDCKQISYINKSDIKPTRDALTIAVCFDKIYKKIFNKIYYKKWIEKRNRINEMQLKFSSSIPHTDVVGKESIQSIEKDFDSFICGSDQIWNPGCSSNMLLDFVSRGKKKIAYAASMGREQTPDDHYMRIKPMLETFTALSVRESCHVAGLRERCGISNVKLMPDPVFLLSKDEWTEFTADLKQKQNKKYIFAYLLGDDLKVREECLRFAERNGYELRYIPYINRYTYLWDRHHPDVCVEAPSVQKFVELIKDAEVVITDSFHGSAFSIIYGKKLISLKRFRKRDKASSNSRIDTLFSNAHLHYGDFCNIPRHINEVNSTISAQKYVSKMKENGMTFLNTALFE